jgi:sarcosine oxidase gamma subunit
MGSVYKASLNCYRSKWQSCPAQKPSGMLHTHLPIGPAKVLPVGATTRTIFGKVDMTIWHQSDGVCYLEFWRSYRRYVAELLVASIAGLPG